MSGIYRKAQLDGRCHVHPGRDMAFTCEQCGHPHCEDCAGEVMFLSVYCIACVAADTRAPGEDETALTKVG